MMGKEEGRINPNLDAPAESNREKHVNFPEVEEESADQIAFDKTRSSDRQKQWKQDWQEGEGANRNSASQDRSGRNQSAMPMDNDDTLGNP